MFRRFVRVPFLKLLREFFLLILRRRRIGFSPVFDVK
jgi:hypothetical protein